MSRDVLGLAGWLLATFAAAAVGGAAVANAGAFYEGLMRPDWAPPSWLFGPVWTVLYILMAVAAWLVWRVNGFRAAVVPLTIFIAQLVVNASWSWLFFAAGYGGLAFADILLLWGLIVSTIVAFRGVSALAGWLLVPYLLWVTFAAVLNYTLWQTNAATLG
jgi:tryptophan-rich sensory protein